MSRTDYQRWKEELKVQGMGMCIQSPGLENLRKAFRKKSLPCEACNCSFARISTHLFVCCIWYEATNIL